jgi:GntR family transcriptional regulator/MocR family aminotransferase
MDYWYSDLAKNSLTPSAVNRLTAEFAEVFREGIDINLGVGYVNDKTIPIDAIRKAYADIVSHPEHYRSVLNYGGADGSVNLRRSIRDYYLRYNIGGLNESDFENRRILIGANGATSILDCLADIIKPGLVITADPYYYIYTETLERKGFTVLAVPEDEKGLNVKLLEETIEKTDPRKISFFYVVTVNNPSTVILSNNRRKAIVEIAKRLSVKAGRILPVIFDKAYEDIIHNQELEKPVSGLKYDELDQVFELGTLSKLFAPALRIGYIILPDNSFADVLTQRTSDIGFSSSLINQEIASWLLDHFVQIQKDNVNRGYREKASYIKELISIHLGDFIESYSGGDAAFYFYITFKNIRTDRGSKFFSYLSRTSGKAEIDGKYEKNPRLIYIPGTICSKYEKAICQLRISYGFEEPEVFERAIKLMAEACRYALS